jgi:hypothetical protein
MFDVQMLNAVGIPGAADVVLLTRELRPNNRDRFTDHG